MARPEYTIRGGQVDAERLARQAAVMARATMAFLTRVGLRPGWACLDVGCGDGQVTVELGRAVGPRGRAVGLDIDTEALDIARQAAERAGVEATFVCADAATLFEREAFDLAYARLVLSHLVDPAATLRAMRAAVRPGGVVAVEDLFTGTLRSDPRRRHSIACRRSIAPPSGSTGETRRSGRACPRCSPPSGLRTSPRTRSPTE